MHPFLKYPKQILFYFMAWIPLIAGVVYMFGAITGTDSLDTSILLAPVFVVEMFLFLSVWYVAKGAPLDAKRVTAFLATHVLTMVAMNAIWLYLAMLYSEVLNVALETDVWRNIFNAMMPLLLVVGFFLYFLSGLLSYLLLALDKTRIAERQALENKLRASQAELQILKATIHPHFMLNSISALSATIKSKPTKALDISNRLEAFLGYSLNYAERESVFVDEEMKHINNYLAIEKIRLGHHLQVILDIDNKVGHERILSFCLQPLVENAIKHGIEPVNDACELNITIKPIKSGIYLEVINPVPQKLSSANGQDGLGLKNLNARLSELYGDAYKMLVHKGEKAFSVKLYLPGIHV